MEQTNHAQQLLRRAGIAGGLLCATSVLSITPAVADDRDPYSWYDTPSGNHAYSFGGDFDLFSQVSKVPKKLVSPDAAAASGFSGPLGQL
ncbi:hypothetical protein [Streptomyces sp. 8N706]|uniref:hypothetical protein n=1 Tax=Streptomyces sp. 8N706 TaxID=3457416 RepID=UPI003FD2D595